MTYEELLAMYDLPAVMYDAVFPFTLLCVFLGPVALFISLMIKLRRVKNIKYSIKNRDQLEDGIAEARQRLEAAYNNLEKNVILIKGSVPGANKSFVMISNGVKANTPNVNPEALVKGE